MILYRWRRYCGYGVFLYWKGARDHLGRGIPFATLAALLCIALREFPVLDQSDAILPASLSISPILSVLGFLVVFRMNLAYQRWSTGMREVGTYASKLNDIAMQAAGFSASNEFKSEVLRLMVCFNKLFFEQLIGIEQNDSVSSLHQRELVDLEEMHLLQVAPSAAHVMWRWLNETFCDHSIEGSFQLAAPILSRTYQVMSDCGVSYNGIRKINETPFPLPFAQICFGALHILALLIPLALARQVDSTVEGAIMSFLTVWVFFSINFTAATLEQPFGGGLRGRHDTQCLPMQGYAREIQADLCSILHPSFAQPRKTALGPGIAEGWPREKWHQYFLQEERNTRSQREMTQPTEFHTENHVTAEFLRSSEEKRESLGEGLLATSSKEELEAIQASAWPRVAQLFHAVHARGHHYVIAS